MSSATTGAAYRHNSNTGRLDNLIFQQTRLNASINQASARNEVVQSEQRARAAAQGKQYTPQPAVDLKDITTHINFTHTEFKPHIQATYSYTRVPTTAGTPSLGQQIQFEIPHAGDLFHDVSLYARISPPKLIVPATTPDEDRPLVRWCSYPGERLITAAEFQINSAPLDRYTTSSVNVYREMYLKENKRVGWDRCMGQEAPHVGYFEHAGKAGDVGHVHAGGITSRTALSVYTGNQTPTTEKTEDLELCIPLQFWFCDSVRLAVPSCALPAVKRIVQIDLADAERLFNLVPRGKGTWNEPLASLDYNSMLKTVYLLVNNIFVDPLVSKIYAERVGLTLVRVHMEQELNVSTPEADLALTKFSKFPLEQMVVGARTNTVITEVRKNMQHWHKFGMPVAGKAAVSSGQTVERKINSGIIADTTAIDSPQLENSTGTPVVTLLAGDKIFWQNQYLTLSADVVTEADLANPAFVVPANIGITPEISAITAAGDIYLIRSEQLEVEYTDMQPIITRAGLKASDLTQWDIQLPSILYTSYLPTHLGDQNVTPSLDNNMWFFPFALFPGLYQPSGHINTSRVRDFHLEVKTIAGTSFLITIYVNGKAINFFVVTGGNGSMHFST